jgi:inosine-uridine nucleoside N-ribohydrolase
MTSILPAITLAGLIEVAAYIEPMARALVLDCDTGTDDAIAIMLAALAADLDLLGVCTVFGNHSVAETTANTARVLAEIGCSEVPVLRGAAGAASGSSAAVEWLVALLRRTASVTLVATGPLTNVAAALRADPSVVDAVDELLVMGGNFGVAEAGPVERNVGNDPAACAAVLSAGFRRVVLVPLDATYQALMGPPEVDALRGLGSVAGSLAAGFVADRISAYASMPLQGRAPVHDPLTVAYLLDPAVVSLTPARVEVAPDGRTTSVEGTPTAQVALSCDAARFRSVLLEVLR